MGNEVGRHPEGEAAQQLRSATDKSFQHHGGGGGGGGGRGVDDGGERRTFRQIYMLQGRIGEPSGFQVQTAVSFFVLL